MITNQETKEFLCDECKIDKSTFRVYIYDNMVFWQCQSCLINYGIIIEKNAGVEKV